MVAMGIEHGDTLPVQPGQLPPDEGGGIIGAGFLIYQIAGY